jgi:BlaI family penicillinase repressor
MDNETFTLTREPHVLIFWHMPDPALSKRERQIMDALYALGEANATDIRGRMDEPPTRTAVRTILSILEAKGHVAHRKVGRNYVYRARRTRQRVGKSALRRVLDVFFDGSLEKAVAAHLAEPGAKLSGDEAKRLEQLIRQSRQHDPRNARDARTSRTSRSGG